MEENVLTKKCAKCGRELPASDFYKSNSNLDGLGSYCKSCSNKASAESSARKRSQNQNLSKVYSNPELAKFQPRELIAELRARGYSGELSIRQIITV